MEHFIGCDAHKKFSVFASINEKGEYGSTFRVGHDLKLFREFLKELPAGSQIALETSGVTTGWWTKWSGRGIFPDSRTP